MKKAKKKSCLEDFIDDIKKDFVNALAAIPNFKGKERLPDICNMLLDHPEVRGLTTIIPNSSGFSSFLIYLLTEIDLMRYLLNTKKDNRKCVEFMMKHKGTSLDHYYQVYLAERACGTTETLNYFDEVPTERRFALELVEV